MGYMSTIEQDLQELKRAIHIKIYADRIELINPSKSLHITEYATTPYSHPRLLIADLNIAQPFLEKVVKKAKKGKFLQDFALVQAMERTEHGITDIEIRVLREFVYNSGFHSIRIYDDLGNSLDAQPLPEKVGLQHRVVLLFLIVLVICGVIFSYMIHYTS